MFKLQSKEPNKNVWLVDPIMNIGSAKQNEIILQGVGMLETHAKIHTSAQKVQVEPMPGAQVYINEQVCDKKTDINLGDILRIATHEYALIDPSINAGNPFADDPVAKPKASVDATVFRRGDAALKPSAAEASADQHKASGWYLQAMHQSLKNKRYPIDKTQILGRSKDCGLAFSYDRLSRQHAEFKLFDGVLFVKDLDSSNGVFHNGQKVTQAKLSHGDTLAFEKLEFTVIGPESAKDQEKLEQSALNETVVRAAITPDMMRQAREQSKKTNAAQDQSMHHQAQKKRLNATIYVVAAVLVAAAIIAAAVFVK